MGLFGGFSRKSGERKREGSHRCMECGMAEGKHTDWCPAISEKEPDVLPDPTLETHPGAEGPTETHP